MPRIPAVTLAAAGLATLAAVALPACRDDSEPPTGTGIASVDHTAHTAGVGVSVVPLAAGIAAPFHINNNYGGHTVTLNSPKPSNILVNQGTMAPGGSTGWHTHAGPVIVTIKSGTFTSYAEDCTKHVYPAGTVLMEPGGVRDVHVGRNEGEVPVEFIAVQIIGVGAVGRIDAPQPADCPH